MLNQRKNTNGRASRKYRVPYLAARCSSALKKKVAEAKLTTGLDESDFLIVAVTEFLANHKTAAERIAAVSRFRVGTQQGA